MSERVEFHMAGRPIEAEPLHYRASGLDYIYLLNGFTIEDDADHGRLITIDDQGDLHRAIGLHIVEQEGEIAGPEVRFLRKLMGQTQAELGQQMGVDAQTIANYEKGKGMPEGSGILLRFIFTLWVLPPDTRASALQEAMASVRAERRKRALPPKERSRITHVWHESHLVAA